MARRIRSTIAFGRIFALSLASGSSELASADWFREHWALVPTASRHCDVRQHERQHGDCRLIDVGVGPCRGERGQNRIAYSPDDGFYITLYRSGTLNFTIGGRDHTLRRGDILIWDPAMPSSFFSDCGSSGVTIHFPGRLVERRLGKLGPLYGFKTNPNDPRSTVLRSHLSTLCSVIDRIPTRQLADLHGATLELAFSCAIKERLQDRKDRARTLLAAIRTDIRENLGQEPVTPSATAKRLKINLRVLQELLAAHRASYGELLTEVRMKRASALLRTASAQELPVQEIALSLGFYDTPHFSNAFRRHFGVSPRQYRNQH